MLAGKDLFFETFEKAEEMFRQTFPNQQQNIPNPKIFEENMRHINALLDLPANFHNQEGLPKNV